MIRRVCVFYSRSNSLTAEVNKARMKKIFFEAMQEKHGKYVMTEIKRDVIEATFSDFSELFMAPFGTDITCRRFTEMYIDSEVRKIKNYKDIINEAYSFTVKEDNILMFSNAFDGLDVWRYIDGDDD
ncbi:hypothetical protein [Bacillus mojavensis]